MAHEPMAHERTMRSRPPRGRTNSRARQGPSRRRTTQEPHDTARQAGRTAWGKLDQYSWKKRTYRGITECERATTSPPAGCDKGSSPSIWYRMVVNREATIGRVSHTHHPMSRRHATVSAKRRAVASAGSAGSCGRTRCAARRETARSERWGWLMGWCGRPGDEGGIVRSSLRAWRSRIRQSTDRALALVARRE